MPQTAKRRARSLAAASSSSHGSHGWRTFAPLAPLAPEPPQPRRSAGHSVSGCPGCVAHPSPLCAACGAATVYALEVTSERPGEDAHALTLCRRCHGVLLKLRTPEAEPLRYLPLTPPQPARPAKRRQPAAAPDTQPARRARGAHGGAA